MKSSSSGDKPSLRKAWRYFKWITTPTINAFAFSIQCLSFPFPSPTIIPTTFSTSFPSFSVPQRISLRGLNRAVGRVSVGANSKTLCFRIYLRYAPQVDMFSRFRSATIALPRQFKRVGMTAPIPFPDRDGAHINACVGALSIMYSRLKTPIFSRMPRADHSCCLLRNTFDKKANSFS